MAKCPLCQGSGKIKVDDYKVMRWVLKDCPVCKPLLDLSKERVMLNKEV